VSEDAPFDAEQHPQLWAILWTGKRSRFRLAQLVCERRNHQVAEIFRSPVGPILLGRGLATEGKDRQRRKHIVRYLERESVLDGAAVSLQCRCSEYHLPVSLLIKQRGRVILPPRKTGNSDASR
jgi:hypothetical protein